MHAFAQRKACLGESWRGGYYRPQFTNLPAGTVVRNDPEATANLYRVLKEDGLSPTAFSNSRIASATLPGQRPSEIRVGFSVVGSVSDSVAERRKGGFVIAGLSQHEPDILCASGNPGLGESLRGTPRLPPSHPPGRPISRPRVLWASALSPTLPLNYGARIRLHPKMAAAAMTKADSMLLRTGRWRELNIADASRTSPRSI